MFSERTRKQQATPAVDEFEIPVPPPNVIAVRLQALSKGPYDHLTGEKGFRAARAAPQPWSDEEMKRLLEGLKQFVEEPTRLKDR
jgi:hypothetical protein